MARQKHYTGPEQALVQLEGPGRLLQAGATVLMGMPRIPALPEETTMQQYWQGQQAMQGRDAQHEPGTPTVTANGVGTAAEDAERRTSGAAASTSGVAAAGGVPSAVDSVEAALQRCDLFCALCTKKPGLLPQLLQVYGQVSMVASLLFRARSVWLIKTTVLA